MAYKFQLRKLCTPALIHFVISFILLVTLLFFSKDFENEICINKTKCNVGNKLVFFSVEGLLILFWTWILDLICKSGYTVVSWLLILLPFILFFTLITLIEINKLVSSNSTNTIAMNKDDIYINA